MDEREQKKEDAIDNIKGKKFLIKPIRTYEDDVANLIKKKEVNATNIVLAEQKRREEQNKESGQKEVEAITVPRQPEKEGWFKKNKNPKHINSISDQRVEKVTPGGYKETEDDGAKILSEKVIIKKNNRPSFNWRLIFNKKVLIFTLLLLGILLIISALVFTEIGTRLVDNIASIGNKEDETTLIEKESNITIVASNKTARAVKREIQDSITGLSDLSLNEISEIEIVKKTISDTEGSSGTQKLSTIEFFRVLESSAPDELIRSLSPQYMLGVINQGEIKPFLLFKTNDIDQSYSQMFVWEPIIYRDLNDIFYTLGSEDFYNPSETELDFDPRKFKDEILLNKDTRAIVNEEGEILFLYSFIDSEHLLMATDIEVMREVIKKLNTQRLIR